MTRDEMQRIVARNKNPLRAQAIIRSRMRRENRREAKKQGTTVQKMQRERVKQAVARSFDQMQQRVVPPVVELKVRE